jgi:hypothetical protein
MTTIPVLFYGINAAPPFNGPLTISETTPGDVNSASFFDTSNNTVNQGISLGQVVKYGYVEIGESTTLGTDYFFLDGKFLGNTSAQAVHSRSADSGGTVALRRSTAKLTAESRRPPLRWRRRQPIDRGCA